MRKELILPRPFRPGEARGESCTWRARTWGSGTRCRFWKLNKSRQSLFELHDFLDLPAGDGARIGGELVVAVAVDGDVVAVADGRPHSHVDHPAHHNVRNDAWGVTFGQRVGPLPVSLKTNDSEF